MNTKDHKYMLITMNDGGLPVITFSDDIQALKDSLPYIQHYLIKNVQTGEIIEESSN